MFSYYRVGLVLLALVVATGCRPAGAPRAADTQEPPFYVLVRQIDHLRVEALPIHPRTLEDIPGHNPIDLGHHYEAVLSPDGKSLALVTWPESDGQGGQMRFIDLATWSVATKGPEIDYHIVGLSYDGKTLHWLEPTATDSAHGMPRSFALHRYEPGGERQTVVTLPESFMPHVVRRHGDRLAIFGTPTSAENLAEDVAHVLLIDLSAGKMVADLRLPGVQSGQRKEGDGYRLDSPATIWAGGKLYVVDPTGDSATVVNLERAKVEHARSTSLLRWLFPVAEAKVQSGVWLSGIAAPDASRFYLFGTESNESGRERTLGLRVLSATFTVEKRLDLPVRFGSLSPDGRHLLLTGERGLYHLDADTLEELAHTSLNETIPAGFTADGRAAYLWVNDSGLWHLRRYDPATRTYSAGRPVKGYFDLIGPLR